MRRNHVVAWTMNGMTIALCAMPIEGQTAGVRDLGVASADAEAYRLGALRASERYRDPALVAIRHPHEW